jgi:tRNA A58 N-methylase Trm61
MDFERHEHGGKSSKGRFPNKEILIEIGVSEGCTFLDAGCGDGHFSLTASDIIGSDGLVFSFDKHMESLNILNQEIEEKGIEIQD